jgi:hypothetical protein
LGKSILPSDDLTLKVYDAIGKEVLSLQNQHAPIIQLNPLKLSPALYHYQIVRENSIVTAGKFAVTR